MRTRRWSRLEYEPMIEKGVFRPDERLELLGGELVRSGASRRSAPRLRSSAPPRRCSRHLGRPGASGCSCRSRLTRNRSRSLICPWSPGPSGGCAAWAAVASCACGRGRRLEPWPATVSTRAASTPAPACPSTGSSTWWTASSRSTATPGRTPPRRLDGPTGRSRVSSAGEHVSPLAAPMARVPVADLLP